jgi:hypothetical protein
VVLAGHGAQPDGKAVLAGHGAQPDGKAVLTGASQVCAC